MNDEIKRYIDRLFERQNRRMRNIVARGTVAMVDDDRKMQENQIQLLDGELIEGAERVQQYGFSSHPQAAAECFVVFAGANREHPLVFSVDDRRYRITGTKAGEVVVYSDEGDTIWFKRGNILEITTKHLIVRAEEDALIETKALTLRGSESIALETPSLSLGGLGGSASTASLEGDLASTGDLKAGSISLTGHVHAGVQPGGGTSAPPQE